MVEENTVPSDLTEEQAQPEAASFAKVPPPESRFLFVDVAALRAKQLRRGARLRIAAGADGEMPADLPKKPERLAMEEVRQGLVPYDFAPEPPKPEGEAQ